MQEKDLYIKDIFLFVLRNYKKNIKIIMYVIIITIIISIICVNNKFEGETSINLSNGVNRDYISEEEVEFYEFVIKEITDFEIDNHLKNDNKVKKNLENCRVALIPDYIGNSILVRVEGMDKYYVEDAVKSIEESINKTLENNYKLSNVKNEEIILIEKDKYNKISKIVFLVSFLSLVALIGINVFKNIKV